MRNNNGIITPPVTPRIPISYHFPKSENTKIPNKVPYSPINEIIQIAIQTRMQRAVREIAFALLLFIYVPPYRSNILSRSRVISTISNPILIVPPPMKYHDALKRVKVSSAWNPLLSSRTILSPYLLYPDSV